jgi:DNA-binding ferritin-like protein (oxidative damage protectant)
MTNPVAESLKTVLADSYALYLKTQNYHWNVTGTHFAALHALFEEHYAELAAAIDEIAELIRGVGEKSPGSFDAFKALTSIKTGNENAIAEAMVKELAADHALIQKTLLLALEVAQEHEDEVIIGALTDRLTVHRKTEWMLKSSL